MGGDWFNLYRYRLTREQQLRCAENLRAYDAYVSALVGRFEQEPGENLVSDMLQGVREGQFDLSRREMVDIVANVIVGGLHTTASAIASVTLCLLSTEGVWGSLVKNPAAIGAAIEEALRLEGVAFAGVRTVTAPVTLAGVQLQPGETVQTLSRAADLDPEKFPDPETFHLGRENGRRHLVYGLGEHVCVGAPLARVELASALTELVRELPDLVLAAPDGARVYLDSPSHRQLQELRVSVHSVLAAAERRRTP